MSILLYGARFQQKGNQLFDPYCVFFILQADRLMT